MPNPIVDKSMPLEEFDQFSATLREAVMLGSYEGQYPIAQLLADVRALANFDVLNERARTRTRRLMIASIIAFVICLWTALGPVHEVWPLALGTGISLIYFLVRWRRHRRADVSDNVRKVALPFLSVLKQDMAASESVRVRLDLKLPMHADKRVGESPPYQLGRYYKIVDTHYRDAWFEGSARLADGTVVRWSVVDQVCESKRRKKNPRGKIKFKTRHMKRSLVEVAVGLSYKRYLVQEPSKPPPPGRKLEFDPSAKRATVKVSSKWKQKSLDPIDPKLLIDAIATAYSYAQPRQGSAA